MTLPTALRLLSGHDAAIQRTTTWADLGCGSGLFTEALAHLLPAGSTLHAVDTDIRQLRPIEVEGVQVIPHEFDFVRQPWPFRNLDGLLMANSLHYVADKRAFLRNIRPYLALEHLLLIVEYDTKAANPWVPYPIPFAELAALLKELGYQEVEKLGEEPSRYRRANIYSAGAAFHSSYDFGS